MTHPDPRVAEILERNRQALRDATGAPPRDVADDLGAYLAWCQKNPADRPVAPTARPAYPKPRLVHPMRYPTVRPDVQVPPRHEQLAALDALIESEGA